MAVLAQILPWLQIVFAVLLVAGILLQRNEASLGGAFGGSADGGVFYAKRGLEKQIFIATIVIAVLFLLTSVATLFI